MAIAQTVVVVGEIFQRGFIGLGADDVGIEATAQQILPLIEFLLRGVGFVVGTEELGELVVQVEIGLARFLDLIVRLVAGLGLGFE
ncbi:MAG TPA: hypothetical protein VF928_09210 [Usitatibacteraceae bacterium]